MIRLTILLLAAATTSAAFADAADTMQLTDEPGNRFRSENTSFHAAREVSALVVGS